MIVTRFHNMTSAAKMRVTSWVLAGALFAYSASFLFRPTTAPSAVGILFDHWVTAIALMATSVGIAIANLKGGVWLNVAHGVALVVMLMFAALAVFSAVASSTGWQIATGAVVSAFGHYTLMALPWPKNSWRDDS